jgi:hypothetical protein
MSLTESEKRDFVEQIIEIVGQSADKLNEKGFGSTGRLDSLKTKNQEAITAEAGQKKAETRAHEATKVAQQKLDDAYNEASATVNLIEGLLGKDDELVRTLRKLRN